MSFAACNARLTRAVLDRLGEAEAVSLTPVDGKTVTLGADGAALRAVIERNVELIGQDGRISDLRMAGSFALADLPEHVDGALVRIGAGPSAEERIVDAVLAKDAEMIRVALR